MAVVLTGMGRDGFEGCQHLSKVGADIVVQDEASSVVWGMPGFIAKAGIARRVLDLSAIGPFVANEIAARAACILPFAGGRPVVRS